MAYHMNMWPLSSGPIQTELSSVTSLPPLRHLGYGKNMYGT